MTTPTALAAELEQARADLSAMRQAEADAQQRSALARTPDDLIRADAEATIAARECVLLEASAQIAQVALEKAQADAFADATRPKLQSLDDALIAALDALARDVAAVRKASDEREAASREANQAIHSYGTSDRLTKNRPNAQIDGYPLQSLRPACLTRVCQEVGPLVHSLGDGVLGSEITGRGRSVYAQMPKRSTTERHA